MTLKAAKSKGGRVRRPNMNRWYWPNYHGPYLSLTKDGPPVVELLIDDLIAEDWLSDVAI